MAETMERKMDVLLPQEDKGKEQHCEPGNCSRTEPIAYCRNYCG